MHGLTGGDWKRAAVRGTAPVPDPPHSGCDLQLGVRMSAGVQDVAERSGRTRAERGVIDADQELATREPVPPKSDPAAPSAETEVPDGGR